MRLVLPLLLFLLVGCHKEAVRQRPPTSAELSQVLGLVQTLEITPPKGARSFAVSQGGSGGLAAFTQRGHLNITVALLQTGCPDDQRRLAVNVGGVSSSLCLKLPSTYSTTGSLATMGRPLPLNRWVPIYAVQPAVPGKEAGSQVMDENPAHWTLVSVYSSDHAKIESSKLPDVARAVELLH